MYLAFADTEVHTVPDLLKILQKYPYSDRPPTRSHDDTNLVVRSIIPQAKESNPPPVNNTQSRIELSMLGDRLYALIIGIDSYKENPLSGCVNDAKAMVDFLVTDLSVSEKQIRVLLNEEASRSGIIQAFIDLRKDTRIKEGYPILIFYAGHGAEIISPEGWETGDTKIQAIVPHDYPVVPYLPDRTIGALIDLLSGEKGDNITVVFDCCHSGSGTRDNDKVRAMLVTPLEGPIDSEIIGISSCRAGSTAPGFERKGLKSHMLIAACSRSECARETFVELDKTTRGRFTVALLALFQRKGLDKLAYKNIGGGLGQIKEQSPQIEGHHSSRLIFNLQGPAYDAHHDVRIEDGKFTLDIGRIHGLSEKAEFKFFDHTSSPSEPLGHLVAIDVKMNSTTLFPLPQPVGLAVSKGIAVQTKAGTQVDLNIHVKFGMDELPVFDALLEQMKATELSATQYRIDHTDAKYAQVAFEVKDKVVVAEMKIFDENMKAYGVTQHITHSFEAEVNCIHRFLRCAAHFYRYLRLSPEPTNKHILSKITFEFMELVGTDDFDDNCCPLMEATGPNIIKTDIIDIVADRSKRYGMRVTNNTPWDLYLYGFLFSASTLRIGGYYLVSPKGSGESKVDSPLTKGNTLMIGHGASGGQPYSFGLEEGQDIDVEFYKFFFSNVAINNMSSIMQEPFGRQGDPNPLPVPPIYGVKIIPVIQRRSKAPV